MRSFSLLLIWTLFVTVQGFGQTDADEILLKLSSVRIDQNQIYSVRDITIRRDAVSIFFNRGTIAFLEPVTGKVIGAVFMGTGEVLAVPPDAVEKQQVYKFTGSPLLNEPFGSAFLRFTDETYEEIIKAHSEGAQEEVTSEEKMAFAPWDELLASRARSLEYRLLSDYLGGREQPLFAAELNSEKLGWFNVTYDQRLNEEVVVLKARDGPEAPGADIWASFNKRNGSRETSSSGEAKASIDIIGYRIDTTVADDGYIQASADVRLRALKDGERVLNLDFSRFLRVSGASLDGAQPVQFYQNSGMTDEEIRRSGQNTLVVVLPQGLRGGEEFGLRFTYAGDVIDKVGSGIFYVGERGLWYPNAGRQDRANFEMTFHFPEKYSLVATGKKVREWEESGLRHSMWTSSAFPVAGFNVGDFTILSDDSGPVPLRIGVNNDVEPIFKEVSARRAVQQELSIRSSVGPFLTRRGRPLPLPDSIVVTPDYSVFSTKGLAESILEEVRSTVSYFARLLGPYPYESLTVSQFPMNYSQGWPSLVYLSTLSFFNPAQRAQLGLNSEDDFVSTELVRAHEIAHQWFGNKVGWQSYHDQWISEAFANYAGAMYVEQKYPGASRMRLVLDNARKSLLAEAANGETYESIGPISLGSRLSTSATPDGYSETIYNKGTWVVHMLRMLMRGEGGSPDEAFQKMIQDFVQTFDGKEPSTEDFKRVAEKHMTKAMAVRGEPNLDWFFDQWVSGTGIPRYSLEYNTTTSRDGFLIEGRIRQEDVPEGFVMPVPVYVDDQLLGKVTVDNDDGNFRFTVRARPARVNVDLEGTILSKSED